MFNYKTVCESTVVLTNSKLMKLNVGDIMKNKINIKTGIKPLLWTSYLLLFVCVVTALIKFFPWITKYPANQDTIRKTFFDVIEEPLSYLAIINATITGVLSLSGKYKLGHYLGDIIKKYYGFAFIHVVIFYVILVVDKAVIISGTIWASALLFGVLIFEFMAFANTFYGCAFNERKVSNVIMFNMFVSILEYKYFIKFYNSYNDINNSSSKFKCCMHYVNRKELKNELMKYSKTKSLFSKAKLSIACTKLYIEFNVRIKRNFKKNKNNNNILEKIYLELKCKCLNSIKYNIEKSEKGELENVGDVFKSLYLLSVLIDCDITGMSQKSRNSVFNIMYESLVLVFNKYKEDENNVNIKVGNLISEFLEYEEFQQEAEGFKNIFYMAMALMIFNKFSIQNALSVLYNSYINNKQDTATILILYLYIHVSFCKNGCCLFDKNEFLKLRYHYIDASYDIRKMIVNVFNKLVFTQDKTIKNNLDSLLFKLNKELVMFFDLERIRVFSYLFAPSNLNYIQSIMQRNYCAKKTFSGPTEELYTLLNLRQYYTIPKYIDCDTEVKK